jgi:hypothetical protein
MKSWMLATAVAVGCGGEADRDPSQGGSGISVGDTGMESDDGIGEVDDGGEKLDTPGGEGGPGGGDEAGSSGCKKVDLLFVIDNSGSMEDEQANLVASFPGFIEGIQSQLADAEGYHVGVITSDLYLDLSDPECIQEGTLITRTMGTGASNQQCDPYASGLRYMTEEDDLAAKFGCAAQVGIGGDGNERPIQTMLGALSDPMNAPGGCNEGFVRDDAILVVVIITDEEDDHETVGCMNGTSNVEPQPGSSGEPPGWYQGLLAVKGGNDNAIVVLALAGPDGADACPELDKCEGGIDGAEVTTRVNEFTEMFTYGFVGPVCQPYGPFFAEAISHIKSACDEFTPVG